MTQCYSAKPHAVTAAFSNTYAYDANGNQVLRRIAPYTHTLTYDAQGRMTGVAAVRDTVTSTITDTSRLTHTLYLPLVSNGATAIVTAATYLYDADGMRVKGVVGGITTVYIAGVYEWQAGATTKYYDGGAMRRTGYASGNGIFYILKDHLGSTSVIVSQDGTVQATDYYYPFGTNRGGSAFNELTSKQFTGQYGASGLAGSEGLNYYGARWYDAQLGQFVSADTVVPYLQSPQAFNRYAYVNNSPISYNDPTGHECDDGPRTWAACYGNSPMSGAVINAANRRSSRTAITHFDVHSSRLLTTGYLGFIVDRSHVRNDVALRIINQVQSAVGKGGTVEVTGQAQWWYIGPLHGGGEYNATYKVTDKITKDDVVGVSLAIYEDYQTRWEHDFQGISTLFLQPSVFSPEDLPSDYLGFIAAIRNTSLESIIGESLGGVVAVNIDVSHIELTSSPPYIVRVMNTSFTPQVGGTNYPWPPELQIAPITSKGGLWNFVRAPNVYPIVGIR